MGTRILNLVLWFAVFLVLSWQNFTAQYQATIYNLQLRVFTEAGLHMRLEPCSCELVWQGRDQVSGAGWAHWRWSTQSSGAICFLSSLLPPHYVEHNKASLIFKLVRHKCFLLPYFHRLCGAWSIAAPLPLWLIMRSPGKKKAFVLFVSTWSSLSRDSRASY